MRKDFPLPPRPPRWGIAAAILWLAGAGLGQPAFATSTENATLDSVIPLEIPVASNGTNYTTVPWNGNILAGIHVEIDSGWSGHVKSWETWLELVAAGGDEIDLPQYGAGDSYPVFQRPHTVDVVEHLLVPAIAYDSFIVAQCNKLADGLRQDGLSDQQIFGEDRAIGLWVSPRLEVDYSGIVNPGLQQAVGESPPDIQIVCQKWQGSAVPAAGAFQSGFQMTGADLHIAPAYRNLTADCPVTVPLVAEFTATNTGNLKFRFVSASGKVSQLRSVNITGKTGGVYKALYEEHIQVPLAQASGGSGGQSSGGGGIVDQQPGSGLAVQTQPEEPLFPTAPSSSGMNQVQQNPVSGNTHQESFRVEVMDPATGIVSDYIGYRITCKPKMGTIATPKALQMQPKPAATAVPMLRVQPQAPRSPQRQLTPMQQPAPQRVAPTQQLAPQNR